MPSTTPEVLTVRSLITSVTKLANHLGSVTPNAIYGWIKLNRIPGRHLLKIAAFYDIDVPMHLAQSESKREAKINHKPRETLPVCIQVQKGELTIEEAAKKLGIHARAVQLIITNWGDQLPLLLETLTKLDAGEWSLDQAAAALQVTKFNIHALRKKYGFKPAPRKKAEPRPIVQRRQTARSVALDAIAGKITLAEVETTCNLSWRTIHRAIAKLSPDLSLIDLTHWPKSLRQAYAEEIARDLPKLSRNLWKYAELTGISLKKWPKYPEPPQEWRLANVKTMMIHVLLGNETTKSIAEKRGADPEILEALFTSDLRPLNLTWEEVKEASIFTQAALAEVLIAIDQASKTPRLRMIQKIAEEKAVDQ